MKKLNWLVFSKTVFISVAGAVLFSFLHFPIPWMLGPLFAVMFAEGFLKQTLQWPPIFFKAALIVIGFMLGSSFTHKAIAQAVYHLPLMLLTTIGTILFCLIIGIIVAKVAKIDIRTGMIGFIPGAFAQMMALSEEIEEVNTSIVGIMQLARVLLLISIIPFILTLGIFSDPNLPMTSTVEVINTIHLLNFHWYDYLLIIIIIGGFIIGANLIHLPTPYLMGPLLAVISLKLIDLPTFELPSFIIVIAQLLFGTYIGLQMNVGEMKRYFNKVLLSTGIACIVLILFTMGFSWILTKLNTFTFVTGFLSIAPGGIDVMGFTAKEVHADLSMITSFQLFRMFFMMTVMPPLLKLLFTKRVTFDFDHKIKDKMNH